MRRISLVLLLLAALASPGWATPLSDVIAGGPVDTGVLTFSDFTATPAGDIPADLSLYDLAFGLDGFTLTGPVGAADGEAGTLTLGFEVAANAGGIGDADVLALLGADGSGAQSTVDKLLLDNGAVVGTLSAFITGAANGDAVFMDSIAFAPLAALSVMETILVDSSLIDDSFGSARVGFVEQTFGVLSVAEPSTLGLLALGLGGLWFAGRAPPGRRTS